MFACNAKHFAIVCLMLVFVYGNTHSAEYAIESAITSQTTYNDNLFLSSGPHDSSTAFTITPTIKALVKEKEWSSSIDAALKNNNYSDRELDTTDKFLNLQGDYRQERNIYSVAAGYTLQSNIDLDSADFGLTGKRINRKMVTLTPSYTRLLNERFSFTTSLAHMDVDYINSANTGLTPYELNTVFGALNYSVNERDQLSLTLQVSDYASKDNESQYQLYILRLGMSHHFSETLSGSFQLGASKRDVTNLDPFFFDFFGTRVSGATEENTKDDGFVVNMGLSKIIERGSVVLNLSRDNSESSTGGLSEVDSVLLGINMKLTPLWSYSASLEAYKSTAISANVSLADHQTLAFKPSVVYSFDHGWRATISYVYVSRKFLNNASNVSTPHSNALTFGITYNFPSISTF